MRICSKCGKIGNCRRNTTCKENEQKLDVQCNRDIYNQWYKDNADYKKEYQRIYRKDRKAAHEFAKYRWIYGMLANYKNMTPEQRLKILFINDNNLNT